MLSKRCQTWSGMLPVRRLRGLKYIYSYPALPEFEIPHPEASTGGTLWFGMLAKWRETSNRSGLRASENARVSIMCGVKSNVT